MKKHLVALFSAFVVTLMPALAFAQDAAAVDAASEGVAAVAAASEGIAAVAAAGISDSAVKAIAAALAIAIAAAFGALSQGKIGANALDGIARNPGAAGKMFVPMLLGMAFVESLVLYAFLIALMIK